MGRPVVPLGELMRHRKEFVIIQPDQMYSRCRVQTSARGIVLRDRVPSSVIKTKKQQVCRAGEFLVAEIDAKMGGYGIVPEKLDGAIVSSHYFLFEIDERCLLRKFLHWYCQTLDFFEQVNAHGSTNYAAVRPYDVLTYTIPLPPLAEQSRIVAKLDKVAGLVEERSRVIETAGRDAQAMLSNAFREIVDGAPQRPMAEVAPLVRRPVEIEPARSYLELGVRSFGRGTFHKPALVGSKLTWQKLFLIQEGDLVFSNIKAWEGAFAVVRPEDHNRVGSHRYLTCVPVEGLMTAGFIWFYLQSKEGLEKVAAASPGSAERNRTLGQKALAAMQVPVPPLDRQRWFDRLQRHVHKMEEIRKSAGQDADALLPALLHRIFNDENTPVPGSGRLTRR